MKGSEFKVSDKRMFTADGRLREEYQHLEDSAPVPANAEAADAAPPDTNPAPARPREEPPGAASGRAAPEAAEPRTGEARTAAPPAAGGPSILDLVGLLAEHTALYLGEVPLPDGQAMMDLRAAKLHLDLLDVLRAKTVGNLTPDESSVLEDILYRLRMIYVEKKRQEA
jgi:hypothetical protein